MKLVVIYRPNSEHGRSVEDYLREFRSRYGDIKIEALDADTREGASMASLYDIMRCPAILALRDDGSTLNIWIDDSLPLMDELAGYAYS
ncbi:MAG TPA: hypothetical protein VFH39_02665 [Candidatus Saccharimonadales bacterium]|nr:hypothetical protein [Candidatus Saccharimonadales bacterium]